MLNEILNSVNLGACEVNRVDQLRSVVAFAEVLQYLLNPPPKWALRDAFILPAKDILTSLAKLNAHFRISAAMCALDLSHPLAFDATVILSVPLEIILKKGVMTVPAVPAIHDAAKAPVTELAPSSVSAVTSAAAAVAGSAPTHRPSHGASISRQVSYSSTGASDAAAESQAIVASSSSAIAATGAVAAVTSTATTPNLTRRTPSVAFADTANLPPTATTADATTIEAVMDVAPVAAAAPTASSSASAAQTFITPAINRRRGNTDQSLDMDERMLLLTGSEMHAQSDQHEHLMRPAGFTNNDSEEGSSGSDEDEDEEDEGNEGVDGGVDMGMGMDSADPFMRGEDEDEDEEVCISIYTFNHNSNNFSCDGYADRIGYVSHVTFANRVMKRRTIPTRRATRKMRMMRMMEYTTTTITMMKRKETRMM